MIYIYIHIYTVPHLRHEMGLDMWSAVDWDGCFVKPSRSINFVPPEVYVAFHSHGVPQ
jgi:hypothetical protein